MQPPSCPPPSVEVVWPKEEPVEMDMQPSPMDMHHPHPHPHPPPIVMNPVPPVVPEAMMFATPETWISSLPSEYAPHLFVQTSVHFVSFLKFSLSQ